MAKKSAKKKSPKKTVAKRGASKPAKKVAARKALPKRKAAAKAKPAPKKRAAVKPAKKAKAAPKKQAAAAKVKAAPKKKAAAKVKAAPKKKAMVRRDATGHLNARYANDLRKKGGGRRDDGAAFIGKSRSNDDLAEQLGEEAVSMMTSGEDPGEDVANQFVDEEVGGPFVTTRGKDEFAYEPDASNPKGSEREPFPRT